MRDLNYILCTVYLILAPFGFFYENEELPALLGSLDNFFNMHAVE